MMDENLVRIQWSSGFLFNANVGAKKQCTLCFDACGFNHLTDAQHDETAEQHLQTHVSFEEEMKRHSDRFNDYYAQ